MNSVRRVAFITGASSGLGKAIAECFLHAGFAVFIVGRDADRLRSAAMELESSATGGVIRFAAGDVSEPDDVESLFREFCQDFDRFDVLVNCVGASDRGLVEELTPSRLEELMRINVHTALLCSRAALPMLRSSGGVIVNVGSLASKVGARYLGGYALAKHALAAMTQQMRLELRDEGVHVGIVCPGPIRRADSETRYQQRMSESLPESAAAPAAGAKIKGLDPSVVAQQVLRCAERRIPEIILPRRLRWFITIGNAFPRLGDWLLLRFTSSNPKSPS